MMRRAHSPGGKPSSKLLGAQTGSAKQPSSSRPSCPPASRDALPALKRDLERMKKLAASALEKPMKTTDYLLMQVEALQGAFISLAETVTSELDDLRGNAAAMQAERQHWLGSMRALQQSVTDKMLEFEKGHLRFFAELSTLKTEVQVSLSQEANLMADRAGVLDKQLFDVKCDVQVVRNQLCRVEAMSSDDVPATVLAQRLGEKRSVEAAVEEAVRGVAGGLVRQHVEAAVPNLVREQVQAVMREVVDRRTDPLRGELGAAAERLGRELQALQRDVRVGEDARRGLEEQAKALEASVSGIDRRVCVLEAEEQLNPRPGASTISSVQDKIEHLSKQQARYSTSMEEVVRALVDDTGRLARTARAQDSAIAQHRNHLAETREALARCTSVFSQLLNVPPPVPLASLASALSPPPPAASLTPASAMSSPSLWGGSTIIG